ncbi:hypothetical protein GCM10011497_37790 [Elstera cyanobacteriorum]|uniref:EF-hand domain-containing protein n=1 Tax=Elstera cyanobacteriorum TaxID=2022747 RepID=A0A255Y2W7_9PROT|nr:hypothetical protein CHR90_00050 [Elstera cyanobacteriorum]GGA03916.1 hypothetical protein GCM10011497_37790 [Elstera cyanobacteriorum]
MIIAPANPYQGSFIWQWYPPSYANGLSADLQFKVSDQGGLSATTTVHITTLWQTPIVLDVSGQGLSLLNSAESGVSTSIFDQTATGTTGWIGAGNAFLALDDDGDGAISAKDIVFTDDAPGAETDMEAVQQAYDSSGSGSLDQADTRFNDFRVWQDRNQDGIADQGEVQTLADAGIASIGLTGARDDQTVNGNIVHRTTEFTRTDGSTGTAADVSLGTIVVTTSIEVTPNPVSTSTVLYSIPNAIPVTAAGGTTQQVTVTSVVAQTVAGTGGAGGAAVTNTSVAAVPADAAAAAGVVASTEAAVTAVSTAVTTTQAAVMVLPTSAGADASAPATGTVTQTIPEATVATTTPSTETSVSAIPTAETASGTESVTMVVPETTATTTPATSEDASVGVTSTAETTVVAAPAAPAALTETSAPVSTAAVDLAASIANQADLLRQAMAAFDPAPSVAAAASATDLLTPAATLAANPISAGDQGDGKLAA